MHDKIKELWEKAATASAAYPSGQNNSWETQVNFMDKFAELIVRECAGIYSKIDNGNLHMGTDDYLEALHKTFFGVEQ